jgi:hypothetical protein
MRNSREAPLEIGPMHVRLTRSVNFCEETYSDDRDLVMDHSFGKTD